MPRREAAHPKGSNQMRVGESAHVLFSVPSRAEGIGFASLAVYSATAQAAEATDFAGHSWRQAAGARWAEL